MRRKILPVLLALLAWPSTLAAQALYLNQLPCWCNYYILGLIGTSSGFFSGNLNWGGTYGFVQVSGTQDGFSPNNCNGVPDGFTSSAILNGINILQAGYLSSSRPGLNNLSITCQQDGTSSTYTQDYQFYSDTSIPTVSFPAAIPFNSVVPISDGSENIPINITDSGFISSVTVETTLLYSGPTAIPPVDNIQTTVYSYSEGLTSFSGGSVDSLMQLYSGAATQNVEKSVQISPSELPAGETTSVNVHVVVVDPLTPDVSNDYYYYYTVDNWPPKITIGTPSDTTISQFTDIEGTAKDDIDLGQQVTLWIQDNSSGLYWDGNSFSGTSSVPIVVPLTNITDLNPPDIHAGQTGTWSYSGLTQSDLVAGDSYTITAQSVDSVGNLSSISTSTFYFDPCEYVNNGVPGNDPSNSPGFNKAVAVFRPIGGPLGLTPARFIGHVGLYVNSDSKFVYSNSAYTTTPNDVQTFVNWLRNNPGSFPSITQSDDQHLIFQAELPPRGVTYASFQQFVNGATIGSDYWGEEEPIIPSALNAQERFRAIQFAGEQLGKRYAFFSGWRGQESSPDSAFRCDGLVDASYSAAGDDPTGGNPHWYENSPVQLFDSPAMGAPTISPPACGAPTITNLGNGQYSLSITGADGPNGSGIDRVEFYEGNPSPGQEYLHFLGVDDHDEIQSGPYSAQVACNPGNQIYMKIVDQAGNYSICDAQGNRVYSYAPPPDHYVPPPTKGLQIGTIDIKDLTDNLGQLNVQLAQGDSPVSRVYYSIDQGFDSWDDNLECFGPDCFSTNLSSQVFVVAAGTHTLYMAAFDSADNISTAAFAFSISGPANSLVGPNINISLLNVHINIDATTPGYYTATPVARLPPLPPGYQLVANSAYDIWTSAQFQGPMTITIQCPQGASGIPVSQMRLFHLDSSAGWQDITQSVNTSACSATGESTTASPFALMVPTSAVPPSPSSSAGGLALSVDEAGNLWEVNQDSFGDVSLQKFAPQSSGQTVLVSSIALPNWEGGGNWSIGFDPSGDAYATASSSGSVVVYAVSPQAVPISSAANTPPAGSQAIVFDATADASGLWIAGALSPASNSGNVTSAQLALWRYNFSSHLLSLTTTYTRNGLDAGFGVRESSGGIWVSGLSVEASSSSPTGPLDLALWKFDLTGTQLLAGPFIAPDYLSGISGFTPEAKLETVGGNFYVATIKNVGSTSYPQFGLGLTEFSPSGQILEQRNWVPPAGDAAIPSAILTNGQYIGIAGYEGQSQGNSTTGVWAYSVSQGTSPASLSFADEVPFPQASGEALTASGGSNPNLWLSVAGSSVPYLFQSNTTLPGTDILVSSETIDTLPPRTSLTFNGPSYSTAPGSNFIYVSSSTGIGLSAVDDASVVFDSAGVGVAQTLFSVDGSTFLPYVSSFTLTTEGLHTLSYYSTDLSGHAEAVQTSSVAVDKTPPVTQLNIIGSSQVANGDIYISTSAFLAISAQDPVSNGVASGLRGTLVSVNGGQFQPLNSTAPFAAAQIGTGTFVASYYSEDNVGNVEAVQVSTVIVGGEPPPPPACSLFGGQSSGGVTISSAPDGSLWMVSLNDCAVSLNHYDSAGVQLSSTALPDASGLSSWNVDFDSSGYVYALGASSHSAVSPSFPGQFAVYRADAQGDLISSATWTDGTGLSFALDISGDFWITGVILDTGSAGGSSVGVWRYCPGKNTIRQTAIYATAPGDSNGGTGIRAADGRVWVADDFTPAATGVPSMALLQFDSQGQTLTAGPFIRQGYDGGPVLETDADGLYIADQKQNPTGGPEDAAFLRYDFSGNFLGETDVAPLPGYYTAFPNMIRPDGQGNFLVGGAEAGPGGSFPFTIWKFAPSGAFLGQVFEPNLGVVFGEAVVNGNLWTAVSGQAAPYQVTSPFVPASSPPVSVLPAAVVSTITLASPIPQGGMTVTPLGNFIYVSQPGVGPSGEILRLGLEGQAQASWPGVGTSGRGALGATLTEDLWAANYTGQTFTRFDPWGNAAFSLPFGGPLTTTVGGLVGAPITDDFAYTAPGQNLVLATNATVGNGLIAVTGSGPGQVENPQGLAYRSDESLYVADEGNARIDIFDPSGNFTASFNQGLTKPVEIAISPSSEVYVSDAGDGALHVFDFSGNPLGLIGGAGQGSLDFSSCAALGFDPAGRLYAALGDEIEVLNVSSVPLVAPPSLGPLALADASPWALDFELTAPSPRAALYELRVSSQPIATLADFNAAQQVPHGFLPGSPGQTDILRVPGLEPGTTYYAAIRAVFPGGTVSNFVAAQGVTQTKVPIGQLDTVAGFVPFSWLGDGQNATLAGIGAARGVDFDAQGNLYLTDTDLLEHQSRIRRVDAVTHIITTIAGGGRGYAGDGGPAVDAEFNVPRGIAVDRKTGNIYISDSNNNRIREINETTGIITTIAGNGTAGFSGDGGPAAQAELNAPRWIDIDGQGTLFVADAGNNRIRAVDLNTGIITTVAGNGTAGYSGDGGPATQAEFNLPLEAAPGLACDAAGDLFISDAINNRIREVNAQTGIISTIAGDGTAGYAGDGGAAAQAEINAPVGVAVDPVGDVYIADSGNNIIREVEAGTGNITTVAGDGANGTAVEDAAATQEGLYQPFGLRLDAAHGLLYIGDAAESRFAALGIAPFSSSASSVTVAGAPAAAVTSTAAVTLTDVSAAQPQQAAALLAPAAAQSLVPQSAVFSASPNAAGGPARLRLVFDPPGVSSATTAIYQFEGTFWSSASIVDQAVTAISSADYAATGVALSLSSAPFAVMTKTPDDLPPRTTLAVSSPDFVSASSLTYVTGHSSMTLSSIDDLVSTGDALGLGVAYQEIIVDSGLPDAFISTFTNPSPAVGQVFASTFALTFSSDSTIADGLHTLDYFAQDIVGNREAVHVATVAVDNTPPISSLDIGQPSFELSSSTVLVSSTTPLIVVSTDPLVNSVASGVAESFVSIGTAPFAAQAAPATLPELAGSTATPSGPYAVRFYSVDNVGNAEVIKSSAVILAETSPTLALFSPAQNLTGIAAVASGQVSILGSVFDLYLSSWTLSYAPGQNASVGFVLISSGSANVSSTTLSEALLGVWNAASLSGWQTLRLSAQDLVGNAASVSVNIYVGSPTELMVLGNPEVFDMPEGVTTDGSGNIYVANTNADQIKVFTATGAFVASYGDGQHDYDTEGSEIDISTEARFNHPRGVAVDQVGNLYVADTGNNRVVKISSTGAVLMTIGKTDKDKEHWEFCESGPLPGQFNHPSDIALDGAGNIYVSDTLNHRVQVFSSSGTFILAFDLPPAESADGGKRDDLKPDTPHWVDWAGDWDDRMPLGNPAGIAVDQAGDIFVADAKGGRGLEFSSTGYLLLTIPISEAGVAPPQSDNGDGHGRYQHGPGHDQGPGHNPSFTLTARPYGIAVSADGSRIYISDAKSSRILDFDALGDQILTFGSRGHIPDNKAPPANIVLDKPAGLALAPDGTLVAADRDNDRVERFGLPNGQPTLIVPPLKPCFDKISDVVDHDLGGDISRSDDAGVNVPPGAIGQDMQLSVSTVTPPDMSQMNAMMQTAQKNGAQPVDAPVDYEPEGTQFAKPVTLTLPYNPDLVAQAGLPETAVQVNYWNPTQQQWLPLQSTVDPSNHTVTAQTSHFSLYQVLTSTSVAPLSLIPANGGATVFNVYNFPNPFDLVSKTVTTINGAGAQVVRGTMIAISLPPDISGGGEIKIFNIAGHLVKTIALGSLQGGNYYYQEWNGTDDDGRDVASGVYIGELKVGEQTKMFKMALIKGSNL